MIYAVPSNPVPIRMITPHGSELIFLPQTTLKYNRLSYDSLNALYPKE